MLHLKHMMVDRSVLGMQGVGLTFWNYDCQSSCVDKTYLSGCNGSWFSNWDTEMVALILNCRGITKVSIANLLGGASDSAQRHTGVDCCVTRHPTLWSRTLLPAHHRLEGKHPMAAIAGNPLLIAITAFG